MTAGFPWIREHKRFREARAAVSQSISMFVREAKSRTGSRGINYLKSVLESTLSQAGATMERNPPPAPGSTLLTNDVQDWKNLSQATGASDAKTDGEALAWMSGLSGGVFPHWLGMGDAYRLATATAMEAPLMRQWQSYQNYWASIWENMVRVVLAMMERYTGAKYSSYQATVTLDQLVEVDVQQLTTAMYRMFLSMYNPLVEAGRMSDEVATQIAVECWQSVLRAIGVKNVESLITVDNFPGPGKPDPMLPPGVAQGEFETPGRRLNPDQGGSNGHD